MEAAMIKAPRRRKMPSAPAAPSFSGDMLLQLYELLQGEREMVWVYSNALNGEICFVNSDEPGRSDVPAGLPVYTARELSFVLSLSAAELRRYHYLKMKLV